MDMTVQGRMRRPLETFLSAALIAVVATALPVATWANPLLSGYGGPGEGSQAIIGSTLVNGPPGGGVGSSGGQGATTSESFRYDEYSGGTGSSGTGTAGAGAQNGAGATGVGSGTGARGGGARHGGVSGGAPGGARQARGSAAGEASQKYTAESETLGLSGSDILYALLALAVLVLTGVLTGRLSGKGRPQES
jgi:hypothetical protein